MDATPPDASGGSNTPGTIWWVGAGATTILGAILGFLPKLLEWMKDRKNQDIEIRSKEAKLRNDEEDKRASVKRSDDEYWSSKYQAWQDRTEKKLEKLETDYMECEKERARMLERVDHLEKGSAIDKITIASQDARIAKLEGRSTDVHQ